MGHLNSGGRKTQEKLFILNGLKTNLLGLPLISVLHLAARIAATSTVMSKKKHQEAVSNTISMPRKPQRRVLHQAMSRY